MWSSRFGIAFTLVAFWFLSETHAEDALERFTEKHLKATHERVKELATQRIEPPRPGPYQEYRANLHVHSAFSHDSRGKIEDILGSAKRAGTSIILFSEHIAPHYDFFKDGHQGMRDGVLMIPGAETAGLLAYPMESVRGGSEQETVEVSRMVRRKNGLTFLCHLEERMTLEVPDLSGVEIYNIHAIFKKQKKLIASMKNPLWLVKTGPLIRQYPQEAYSAIHEYPADYLSRWDELCQRRPHTGVSANDAHQNIGLKIQLLEGNKLRMEDALGVKLLETDATLFRPLLSIPKDARPGTEVFGMQLDRYEFALRHAATHLLMKKLTREEAWDALEKGRAFVGFDWMADTRGFDFHLQSGQERFEMGGKQPFARGIKLQGLAPLNGHWKVLRNGQVISEKEGNRLDMEITGPGVYRAEVWLDVAGKKQIWILSNPLYVTKP